MHLIVKEETTNLHAFINECAAHRYNITMEEFLYWYEGVAVNLLKEGLPEANVIDLLKKHRILVGYIKAHCNGLTPEKLAKRFLEKPKMPKVYDEYAKPKIRVTSKVISEFRKELESEYRKAQGPDDRIITEEYIQERCYGVHDDYIKDIISSRQSAADFVFWDTY